MEINVVRNVLAENENLAGEVRKDLRSRKQSLFNFMSSPGSGKTTLLQGLIPLLKEKGLRVGVIEGDITTTNDAERLQPLNIPISQINTDVFGGDCHLGANVIQGAMKHLNGTGVDMALIENVGNLVCPAEFDTGADINIVLLSVTEGEDKPQKYPLMFRKSHIAVIHKVDLVEAVEANVRLMKENMMTVNPELSILEVSGKRGTGLQSLAQELLKHHKRLTS